MGQNFPAFLRKGDVVALDGRFFVVEASQYALDQSEVTIWLELGLDHHPDAPYG